MARGGAVPDPDRSNCSETRQEFILLSDTLGISMLVDVVDHRQPQGATETTVLGPF